MRCAVDNGKSTDTRYLQNKKMEQKKSDRSLSNAQRLITDEIEQLDIILNILNDNEQRPHTENEIYNDRYFKETQSYILPKDFRLALDKLILDGYVIKIEDEDWRTPTEKYQTIPKSDYYRITYSGRLFLKNTSKNFSQKPYRESLKKQRQSDFYTKAKTAGIIFNAIMILFLGYWQIRVTNKSDKLENDLNTEKELRKKSEQKFDSLLKLKTDTTLLHK